MKQFALSLNSPSVYNGTSATQAVADSAAPARLPTNNFSHAASSATSRFADSAYASMSGSGQSGTANKVRKQSDQPARQSNSNLQSYLQEIPEGLLPRERVPMSDWAQKKMIVKRLEQVFAGKGQTDRGYQQPQQQEEVAQSAACADRRAKRESGRHVQAEGLREARIMPAEDASRTWTKLPHGGTLARLHSNSESEGAAEKSHKKGSDSEGLSPNQRPTRPLDLDPYRAQVPDENLEYMRHLGFSPTDVDSSEAPRQDHGWIYLNLLMNMAQLHTINVTPELVKKAIFGFSDKLELSRDGRKVRWKGGRDLTKLNSDNSTPLYRAGSATSSTKGEMSESPGRSKRQKTRHGSADGDFEHGTEIKTSKKMSSGCAKHPSWYSPVLYRHERSEESDQSEEGYARFNTDRKTVPAETLHPATSEPASRPTRFKRCQNDGPIIFYSNARFCTDLSGDSNGRQVVPCNDAEVTSITYKPALDRPIGDTRAPTSSDDESDDGFRARRSGSHAKGPLSINDSAQLLDAMALDDREQDGDAGADGSKTSPGISIVDIDFPVHSFSSSQEDKGASKDTRDNGAAMDIDVEVPKGSSGKDEGFAVSGLGGVHPDDNFAIDVECRLVRNDVGPDGGDEKEVAAVHRSYDQVASWRRYHPRIREALRKGEVSVPATTSVTDFAIPSASNKGGALMANFASHTHRSQPLFKEIIVSARLKELPASVLPPPVFLSFPSTSDDAMGVLDEDGSDKDGSDEEEEVNVDVKSPCDVMATSASSREQQRYEDLRSDVRMSGPSVANENDSERGSDVSDGEDRDDGEGPTHMDAAEGFAMRKGKMLSHNTAAAASSSRKTVDSASPHHSSVLSSAGASSSSVDFLAEARELDPEFVREREREYAADMAERLAEEIPAGSSAATAGGGSGYNSPKVKRPNNTSGSNAGSDDFSDSTSGGSTDTESG